MKIFVDSFDHDSPDITKLRGEKLDRAILSRAKRVSVFWITETQARARRIDDWIQRGKLELDNKKYAFPWLGVTRFDKD